MLNKKSLLVSVLLTAFCVAPQAMAREFLSADVHGKDFPTTKAVNYMGEQLNKASGGKYKIKVFSPSALGSEKDTVEQVKIGALDMVRVSTATFHSMVPESVIPAMPFLFRDIEHFRKTMYGPQGDKILASFEKAGFIGLCLYEAGARSMYGKKPIRNLADLKDLKVRVQPSDLMMGMVSALGAQAKPVAYAEVLGQLKGGVIDAAENNYPSFVESKHFEVSQVYSETMHSMTPEVVVFSKVVWDKLDKETQAAIRKAAKDSVPFYVKQWETKEKEARTKLVNAGVQIVAARDIDRKALVDSQKPVWDKFARTAEQKALLREITSVR